jgi:hypothetical protein
MLFSQLDVIDAECEQLAAAQSASDQHGQDGVIPLAARRIEVYIDQEALALLCGEPVSNSNSNPPNSLNPSDAGRKLWGA